MVNVRTHRRRVGRNTTTVRQHRRSKTNRPTRNRTPLPTLTLKEEKPTKIIIPSIIKKDLRGHWEKNITGKREDYLTLRIYREDYFSERQQKTFYDVQIFKGRGQNAFANVRFSTEKSREDYIQRIKDNIKSNEEEKTKRKKERSESYKTSNIKVGDLFQTSWGYDQTNYEFIKVVRISPSGKTAYCKQAMRTQLGSESIYNKQTASTQTVGKEFPMNIIGNNLRGTYWKTWNHGESEPFRMDTFSPVEKGKEYYETDSRFGH